MHDRRPGSDVASVDTYLRFGRGQPTASTLREGRKGACRARTGNHRGWGERQDERRARSGCRKGQRHARQQPRAARGGASAPAPTASTGDDAENQPLRPGEGRHHGPGRPDRTVGHCRRSRTCRRRSSVMCRSELGIWSPMRRCAPWPPKWLHPDASLRLVKEIVDELLRTRRGPLPRRFSTTWTGPVLDGTVSQDAVLRDCPGRRGDPRPAREGPGAAGMRPTTTGYGSVNSSSRRWSGAGRRCGHHRHARPFAVATVSNQLGAPEDVVNVAFLVDREHSRERGGGRRQGPGRCGCGYLGPVTPYDFIPTVGGIG